MNPAVIPGAAWRPLRLVLLPGLDATDSQHAGFSAAMQQRGVAVTVIAYPRERALDYAALADFIRQRLPVDSDYMLLGESFSGPLALSIAATPPPHLRGLILSTTFARSPWLAWRWLQSLLYWAPVRALPLPGLSWLLLGRWSTPALRAALQAALASVHVDVLRTRAVAALGVDVAAQAVALRLPTLCLHAVHDRLLPARCQRQLSMLLPDQSSQRLDGPHLMLQARPQAAADVIAAFMHRTAAQPV